MSKTRVTFQCYCEMCKRDIWLGVNDVPYTHCPGCGEILPPFNNYSSEDADDGFFTESQGETA